MKPFIPAHHRQELFPIADAVLFILFPELGATAEALDTRQKPPTHSGFQ
jgi:hypothetical protein